MSRLTIPLLLAATLSTALAADPSYPDLLRAFTYRNLGPFRAGAWVAALAVPETPPHAHARVMFAGARTGGVWRTTNSGTTWEPVTDRAGITSVGAVAVAPSDANVVWVGTGDNSLTRSAYFGDGVYKSIDGGSTWVNMGLHDSQHIARIVIHPSNPDIVWVAALGHEYSPKQQRGVYQSTDGGRTWTRQLFVNPTTGAVDLVIDPQNPQVLYAALYDAMRYPWKIQDGGPGSGIYKTTDGGKHWDKLANGLPQGILGRIGIDLCRSHPEVLYAVIDNFNLYTGPPRGRGGAGGQEKIGGEVYRSSDAGRTWQKVSPQAEDVSRKAGYSFNQIRVDPNNPDRVFITGSSLLESDDGGRTWPGLRAGGGRGRLPFQSTFGDFRSLWIDPQDSTHMVATSDGGVTVSYDGGRTTDHFSNLELGEVYAIGADMQQPYNIYEGLQDHENWKGPVDGWSGSVTIDDWVTTGIGDGMYNQPDPTGRWLYNDQELGSLGRVDMQLRTRTIVDPTKPGAPHPFTNVGRLGPTGVNGPDKILYRFNWTAPVRISPQDHNTIYYGSQFLLRSRDRGDHWDIISPDLTTNDPDKINTRDTSIQHCTIVTIDESPAQAGVIWAGTDDGRVQVTRDTGAHWTNVTGPVAAAGAPEDAWVTRVYASRYDPATAYVTKSRRRQDDFKPYVLRTTDYGATWTMLTRGLPAAAEAAAIVEDTVDRNLLFLGTTAGVYVSFDRGANWHSFQSNMPPAPVTDLLVHPREGDLVVGTYGRGVWVTNIVPLRGMGGDFPATAAALLPIRSFAQRHEGAWGNYRLLGDRYPSTPNEPNGMVIAYYLKDAPANLQSAAASPNGREGGRGREAGGRGRGGRGGFAFAQCVSTPADDARPYLTIADPGGQSVCTLALAARAGMNQVTWNLTTSSGRAEPGEYTFALHTGGKTYTQKARLVSIAIADPRSARAGDQ
ncbi:MAG TPA: hypothetical protein VME43_32095 [Bryobacteraceae bacterium]|nr:hypothetical protein [Bryobacteraceae bacterium]